MWISLSQGYHKITLFYIAIQLLIRIAEFTTGSFDFGKKKNSHCTKKIQNQKLGKNIHSKIGPWQDSNINYAKYPDLSVIITDPKRYVKHDRSTLQKITESAHTSNSSENEHEMVFQAN